MQHLLSILPQLFYIRPHNRVAMLFAGVIVLIFVLVLVVLLIFYLLTLQNTLKAVSPQNRQMRPGQVWLLVIPVFGTIWNFFVASKISASIEQEFRSRHMPINGRPTYSVGLAYCIIGCCSLLLLPVHFILRFQHSTSHPFELVRTLISIVGLICWIIYWAKVNEYKNTMLRLPANADGESKIFSNLR